MTITVRSTSSVQQVGTVNCATSGTPIVLTAPAGLTVGDYYVVMVDFGSLPASSGISSSDMTGFTELVAPGGGGQDVSIWGYPMASSADVSAVASISISPNSTAVTRAVAVGMALTGVSSVGTVGSWVYQSTASSPLTFATLTGDAVFQFTYSSASNVSTHTDMEPVGTGSTKIIQAIGRAASTDPCSDSTVSIMENATGLTFTPVPGWDGTVGVAFTAAAVAQTANASLAGSGTLTAASTVGMADVATLAGAGTLTATPTTVNIPGSAALSGSGTLAVPGLGGVPLGNAPLGGYVQVAATAGLSGTGTLTAASSPTVNAVAALNGTGTLTGTVKPTATAAATLSGTGTLAGTVKPTVTTPAPLTGTGTLTATTAVLTTATLTGTGTLATSQAPQLAATAALTGTGALTATGQGVGQATLTGTGSLTTTRAPSWAATAALSGSGSLSLVGAAGGSVASILTGAGTLTAAQNAGVRAGATLTGTGILTDTATVTTATVATLTGTGTLTVATLGLRDLTLTATPPTARWSATPLAPRWASIPEVI
jgi:hypothetical protein